jgi:tRNA U38,U39,U40 pseudouridine synthase TruA
MFLHDRTDRGVHALRSSAHVDLEHYDGLKYDPAHLTAAYNRYFTKANLDLR